MRHKTSSNQSQNYHLEKWAQGYFQIEQGKLVVCPTGNSEQKLALSELVERLLAEQNNTNNNSAKSLQLPLLVRFPQILKDRIAQLSQNFQQAIEQHNYQNEFVPIYPIKVNQQQPVVDAICQGQKQLALPIGLEAGSKPELIAVLAQASRDKAVIVCNGYKDQHYIRLALLAEKLGHEVYIVIEKMSELPLVLAQAKELDVQPRLGLRAKLASIGKGNWQNTGGEKSKFGLSSEQILKLVKRLKEHNQLDCLQLLHFHLGSQIANLHDINMGLRECTQIFAQLVKLGVDISTVDVGGGLAVDYEGTGSRNSCSMNYSLAQYADAVVSAWQQVSQQHGIGAPKILTESGRAITAHHAVLISNIIDNETAVSETPADEKILAAFNQGQRLLDIQQSAEQYAAQHHQGVGLVELYHDALYWLQDMQAAFSHGSVDLEQRAQAEIFSKQLMTFIAQRLNAANKVQREVLDEINEKLADKVFVNFSLFQSLPDIWGIDQIFPILPLQNLDQAMQHRAVLQDITCDSDGRIEHYVDAEGIETSLPLPSIEKGTLLGFFMVGAYQEILGDMHNLFGDTDAIDVELDAQGQIQLANYLPADSIAEVLEYVHFNSQEIIDSLQQQVEASAFSDQQKQLFAAELAESLTASSYLV